MVVIERLGNMQDLARIEVEIGAGVRQQIIEISRIGFVTADILGGIYGVELNIQQLAAAGKRVAINVRKDN